MAPTPPTPPPPTLATSSYDKVYPYYVEVCAVTAEKLKGQSVSGAGGHAVLYLKGVCRDTAAGYPRLRLCQAGEKDLSDPESGTAISVDEVFKNVNWMAVDGRDLLLTGGLRTDETLTVATRDRAVQKILSGGMMNGILPHAKYLEDKPAGMSDQEHMARLGIGLNFGLTFGRNAYCARLPVSRDMLEPMVNQLNRRNEEFIGGAKDFNWNVLSDNCAHAAHNAVAAANVFESYKINAPLPEQLFNLAVPSNEYIDWLDLGNETDIDDPEEIYNDDRLRSLLLQRNWLPAQPGVLSSFTPVHASNDLYETDDQSFLVLEFPLFSARSSILNRAQTDARYYDLTANLTHFRDRYRAILSSRRSSTGDRDFDAFLARYYAYVSEQLSNVERSLATAR